MHDAAALVGLPRLVECFGLSPLERDIVVHAAAVEVSARTDGRPTVAALASAIAGGDATSRVTAALYPGGHLIRCGLVEVVGDGPFGARIVRIPDDVWPRLVGLPVQLTFPVFPRATSTLAQLAIAPATRRDAELAATRTRAAMSEAFVVVCGPSDRAPEAVATAFVCELGLGGMLVPASAIEDERVRRVLRREATWLQAALVIQGLPSIAALAQLAVDVAVPVVVVVDSAPSYEACAIPGRWRFDVVVADLPLDQRIACWRTHLAAPIDDGAVSSLAARLRFGPARIAATAAAARELAAARGETVGAEHVLRATRQNVSPTGGLAQRLEGDHVLSDVVVSSATRRELALAVAWARHAATAFTSVAAGRQLRHRDGLVCLFHGPPGTGKTLAARAIAGELAVDLLRIDLSQVVNKYIGETEKNLDRVFDQADAAGAILFFDEADALFGKRTEIKDAHDRYANVETAFLLQRLELYRGVCILASNHRQNVDEAFTRRIHVIAEFKLPGVDERRQIWERHLVLDELDRDVELAALSRFALSGGDIANAAATALVLATADGARVGMRHLVTGVWRELRKSGRLTSAEEFGRWRELVTAFDRGA